MERDIEGQDELEAYMERLNEAVKDRIKEIKDKRTK